jgi:taurine dioxygenase
MSERLNPSTARPVVSHQAGITVRRAGVNLGAEISGIDLRQPLLDAQFEAIGQALVDNELIIFRDQDITSEQLMAFGRRFGDLTVHPFAPNEGKNAPELIKFRNDETTPPFGTDVWHSDETFRAEPPMATILVAKEVPAVGGDTMFASMTAAYEGLSDKMQQYISGLYAFHDMKPFRPLFGKSLEERKKLQDFELKYPPILHPVVRVHPVSGRKSLFVNSQLPLTIWKKPRAVHCSTFCSNRLPYRNISTAITGNRTPSQSGTTARRSITRFTIIIRSAVTWSASQSRAARLRAWSERMHRL